MNQAASVKKTHENELAKTQAKLLRLVEIFDSPDIFARQSALLLKNFEGNEKEKNTLKKTADFLAELLSRRENERAQKKSWQQGEKSRREKKEEHFEIEKKLLESYKHLGTINRQISILFELNMQNGARNDFEILSFILNSAINASQADSVVILKYERKKGCLSRISLKHSHKIMLDKKIPVEKSAMFKDLVAKKIRIQGSFIKKMHGKFMPSKKKLRYFLLLPITSSRKLKGAIALGFSDREYLTPQELNFYEAFSSLASLVLKEVELFKEKRK